MSLRPVATMFPPIVLAMSLLFAASAQAESGLSLDLPIECPPGETCVIQNYFDHTEGPEAADYACGALTYDGHDGTDFRVPDLAAMTAGVPVLAAAAGRVRAVRDGVRDVDFREIDPVEIDGREAGNAVVLVHDGGWETQYSHLLRGSVSVRPGDNVSAGQRLGSIGMSGKAAFPHVHFEVRLDGRPVDPFVGLEAWAGCGGEREPLWTASAAEALGYRAGGLLGLGFADRRPDYDAVKRGVLHAPTLSRTAPVLAFWFNLYGVEEGDIASARIVAPGGEVFLEEQMVLERRQAQWFGFVGRRLRDMAWPGGSYRGELELLRQSDGKTVTLVSESTTVELR